MNIALIAHDDKKDDMIRFTIAYGNILKEHSLFATGTTEKDFRGYWIKCSSVSIRSFRWRSRDWSNDSQK